MKKIDALTSHFEPQYQILENEVNCSGLAKFGSMSSFTWNTDPKRLLFVLARYKFAAKMLAGRNNVLEIGCGDGFGARIVRQHVANLTISDADELFVSEASQLQHERYPVAIEVHDFAKSSWPKKQKFDGVYLLDVLEHISPQDENTFLKNVTSSLDEGGVAVVGMPSTESQVYASVGSKAGHVNCKTQEELRDTLEQFFKSVLVFSMNDEVVHTGFARMANYIFAVGHSPLNPR
jgi:2-polyprenyl-3-methyl-5-hydroxy-6-metoxy-1,4-benzoquinol methylase